MHAWEPQQGRVRQGRGLSLAEGPEQYLGPMVACTHLQNRGLLLCGWGLARGCTWVTKGAHK